MSKKQIEIKVVTYEEERTNHFIELMKKAQSRYDRLYKRYKDSPYLSEGATLLSDAGRELQFYIDVIAMLRQDNRKQSEWISVEERLPEEDCLPMNCLVAAKVGDRVVVDWATRGIGWGYLSQKAETYWEILHDWDEGEGCEITHWMPLPEAPKMKGGE